MTDQQLEHIERRVVMATAEPWIVDGESWEGDGAGGVVVRLPDKGVAFVSRWTDRGEPEHAQPADFADAYFIAHARADVPALLAEVRRLQGLIGGQP